MSEATTQHSVLVSATALVHSDPKDDEDDAFLDYPGLASPWVSNSELRLHARGSDSWFKRITNRVSSQGSIKNMQSMPSGVHKFLCKATDPTLWRL